MIQRTSPKRPVVKGAAAFAKSIGVLQLVADSEQPPTIAELVRRSALPRPTLHRLLKALSAEGLIDERSDKTYSVGARVIHLAGRALQQNDLGRLAEDDLKWLCDQTRETVHLAIWSGEAVLYAQKNDSPQSVRIASTIAGRAPVHASAIGKVIVANLPEEELADVLIDLEMPQLTKFTITDKTNLIQEFQKVREQGFAIARQESDLEIQCFGACIRDGLGDVVGGISVSVPLFRMQEENSYLRPLLASAHRITEKLGGVPGRRRT